MKKNILKRKKLLLNNSEGKDGTLYNNINIKEQNFI